MADHVMPLENFVQNDAVNEAAEAKPEQYTWQDPRRFHRRETITRGGGRHSA
ncbi:hypothetical protein MBOU_30970 [Mycobacterium bourgelatii]|uniref:Uncharacterized protein n=1 Tax=Mycobacterium bourgelatii TaxID=1273442 RepID=A0A7I9YQV4_MYCBU|nr:hypothetical protein MBOU_30970 [Mycobacterium bourgelatii]